MIIRRVLFDEPVPIAASPLYGYRLCMYDLLTITAIAGAFFLAGTVKGVIGLGLPTVSLAILTVLIDIPNAMALMLVPSFLTNLYQASIGGYGLLILRRLWPFMLMATITVWLGAVVLTRVDFSLLSALLGLLITIYGVISLAGVRLVVSQSRGVWLGPIAGAVNGFLTGMTGSFVFPGVMFLEATGLTRDQFIQAMGILFTLSTLALGICLSANNLLNFSQGQISTAALLPALAGMVVGRYVRQLLSPEIFRLVFFTALLMLGLYILANGLGILF